MAEKVTLKQFSTKLPEYASGGAARKAIGRFNGWSDEEKNKARKLVDAHFGTPDNVVPKGKTVKKVAKPVKVAKAPKAVRAPRAKAAAVPTPRKPRTPRATSEGRAPVEGTVHVDETLLLADLAIRACSTGADNVAKMANSASGTNFGPAIEKIVSVQNSALDAYAFRLVGLTLRKESVQLPAPKAEKRPTEVKAKTNGAVPPTNSTGSEMPFATPAPAVTTQI